MPKYVYTWEEADYNNVKLFGGKASGLAMMAQLGLPVPSGIVITTEACKAYYEAGKKLPPGLMDEVREKMKYIEEKSGRKFGDPENPLLVSVRSGAAVSMPGMMDTVLNLGINDKTLPAVAKQLGNERAAWDVYRRFLQMYGRIVLGIDEKKFNDIFEEIKKKYGAKTDAELNAGALKEITQRFKELIKKEKGDVWSEDPWKQLEMAIAAVFDSWESPRAVFYRKINNITPDIADGTAVSIVMMVFGNAGFDSGTGVVFSRDPSTGEDKLYGEFLALAQGEDVVAGIRTPMSIDEMAKTLPEAYKQLYEGAKKLEKFKKAVQDIEFTVEHGKLYFLQTRNGKLGPLAAVKVAVDMYKEGMITKEEALLRVKPEHIIQLLYPRIDPKEKTKPIAKGLPSSPGAVSGRVVFDADSAVVWAQRGEKVILVREETKPDDVHGMYASVGILTSRGGMTSHAAVVARAIGRPSVVGCEDIVVDYANRQFTVKGTNIVVKEGEWITIDGFSGNVYIGQVKTVEAEPSQEFYELLKWADEERSLGVWANADQPDDAQLAKKFGAEGIGLLRTERMFRRPDRLEIFRKAILTDDEKERRDALNQLVPMMKKDFEEMLEIMEGRPVIIRLFDPPVHEFLPNDEEIVQKLAELRARGGPENEIKELESTLKKIRRFKEANPMMGRRGVRLGITYPEIYEAQVRAILSAAAELLLQGKKVHVKIMVPQVASANELSYVRQNIIEPVAKEIEKEYNINLNFEVGTMMETVRACLTADEIAKVADFFSFGTNDLTQATFSFSRDDVENEFMPKYLDLKILPYDPFETLDEGGVARLIDIAVKASRSVKPNLEVGICGEHGGDPKSIEIAHRIGVSYVSASPYRIPVARLAAAHAAIKAKGIKVYEY